MMDDASRSVLSELGSWLQLIARIGEAEDQRRTSISSMHHEGSPS